MQPINDAYKDIIQFDDNGLVPAVVQSIDDNTVLMLAYMDEAAIEETLKSGYATYYSRSRKSRWKKGETSGNVQQVQALYYDCDADSILLKVKQTGVACHKNKKSCFHNPMGGTEQLKPSPAIIDELYSVITNRKKNPKEGAYTTYLFNKGIDKILKKVGEESSEVIIASKNASAGEMIEEISDLVYHVLVLMANEGVTPEQVSEALEKRRPSDDS